MGLTKITFPTRYQWQESKVPVCDGVEQPLLIIPFFGRSVPGPLIPGINVRCSVNSDFYLRIHRTFNYRQMSYSLLLFFFFNKVLELDSVLLLCIVQEVIKVNGGCLNLNLKNAFQ